MEINFPGEKFLCKLLEMFKEMGAGLAEPWQTLRVGKAQTQVKADEIRQLATAQKDAHDILAGVKTIDQQGNIVLRTYLPPGPKFSPNASSKSQAPPSVSPVHDTNRLLTDALARVRYRELKREINLRAIALLAQDENVPDEEVADQKVSEQWATRWIDGAQDVSDEELRILWGKLLTGEVKRPGSYSLRTVEFLRSVSPGDAKKIAQIAGLAIRDNIFKKPAFIYANQVVLKDVGISTNLLLELCEAGVLNTASLGGLSLTLTPWIPVDDRFQQLLFFQRKVLMVETDNPTAPLRFPAYKFTNVGAEIISLGDFDMNGAYLASFVESIKNNGFRVFRANVTNITDEGITLDGREEL